MRDNQRIIESNPFKLARTHLDARSGTETQKSIESGPVKYLAAQGQGSQTIDHDARPKSSSVRKHNYNSITVYHPKNEPIESTLKKKLKKSIEATSHRRFKDDFGKPPATLKTRVTEKHIELSAIEKKERRQR